HPRAGRVLQHDPVATHIGDEVVVDVHRVPGVVVAVGGLHLGPAPPRGGHVDARTVGVADRVVGDLHVAVLRRRLRAVHLELDPARAAVVLLVLPADGVDVQVGDRVPLTHADVL